MAHFRICVVANSARGLWVFMKDNLNQAYQHRWRVQTPIRLRGAFHNASMMYGGLIVMCTLPSLLDDCSRQWQQTMQFRGRQPS